MSKSVCGRCNRGDCANCRRKFSSGRNCACGLRQHAALTRSVKMYDGTLTQVPKQKKFNPVGKPVPQGLGRKKIRPILKRLAAAIIGEKRQEKRELLTKQRDAAQARLNAKIPKAEPLDATASGDIHIEPARLDTPMTVVTHTQIEEKKETSQ